MNTSTIATQELSVLKALRSLVPTRTMLFAESLRIAERQAGRLRELLDIDSDAFPEQAISGLPRIRVVRRSLPTSGMGYWDGQQWVVATNGGESEARQRFTLLHEYKHILDHGQCDRLYTGTRAATADKQAEQAADYFAGCVLMPKVLVNRAWVSGHQRPEQLAAIFDVSSRAAEVRLAQIGLTEPIPRCAKPYVLKARLSRPRYFRTANWSTTEWSLA